MADLTPRRYHTAVSKCYAFMQATGMVNDHLLACFRHEEVQAKR